nr:MAG TPA: cysteine-rich protein [Caudoviricetes sp.]
MSITDAIKDMEKHMGMDFSDYMNEPLPHNEQAYIQRDYKTGTDYICCPFCGKKNFPLTPGAKIQGQKFKCKGSSCKQIFEVDV